jgi:hypothetical protein
MVGECSPYDALTNPQKRRLMLAYYNMPSYRSALAQRTQCVQSQIAAQNQAALSSNMGFAVTFLIGAILLALLVRKVL